MTKPQLATELMELKRDVDSDLSNEPSKAGVPWGTDWGNAAGARRAHLLIHLPFPCRPSQTESFLWPGIETLDFKPPVSQVVPGA